MAKQVIKDFYGRIIGTLETNEDSNPEVNGDVVAKDFYGRILGFYRKKRNITTDFYGRILGTGDMTAGLIYQAQNKK